MASPQKLEMIAAEGETEAEAVPAAAGSPAASAARAWSPFHREAKLLASSLRSLPLTLVHGSDAAARSALLQRGVLPLLGRRQEDRTEGRAGAGTASAGGPTRRALWLPRGSEEGGEHVLFVDLADPQPRPPLAAQLADARRDRPGGRVLMLLQGVEHPVSVDPEHCAAFWRVLLQELQAQPPALHLLIAAESCDGPALLDLARSLPGFGDNAVRLPPRSSSDACAIEPGSELDAMAKVRAATPAAAKTALQTDPQRLATLDRADERVAEHEPQPATPATAAPGCGVPEAAAPRVAEVHRSAAAHTAPMTRAAAASLRHPARWLGVAATACVLVLGWMLLRSHPEHAPVARASRPPEPATVAMRPPPTAPLPRRAPSPEPSLAPVGGTAVAFAPSSTAPVAEPREEPGKALLRALAPLPAVDLRVGRVALAGSLSQPGRARLGLVRYDALQTLPADARLRGLAVVAPLFIEPVMAWVPVESPLHHWHQLRGRRLDIGAAGSGAALTAAGTYRALFGQLPPATPADGRVHADASVSIGGGFDAALRVGDSPVSTGDGRVMRALTLAADDPSTSALLRQYLPQALAGGGAGARTPAVMNFLIVDGGNAADREHLAAAAWRALCSALPQLRADGHPSWAAVRPGDALPAGRPYAGAAQQATGECAGTVAVAATSPAVTPPNR